MIRDFKDKLTEQLFKTSNVRAFPPEVVERARRKLMAINAAHDIGDLRVPPSNRLEKLRGNREGQHSIRINDQWRICFRWVDGDAYDVEVCDYH
jgi:proteic killer suppression protein